MVSWKTLTQFWFSDHVPVSRILLELAYILDKIYILMSYKLIEFESLESEKYLYLYLSVDSGCTRRLEPVDLWACEIRVRINATRVLLVYAPPTTNGLD